MSAKRTGFSIRRFAFALAVSGGIAFPDTTSNAMDDECESCPATTASTSKKTAKVPGLAERARQLRVEVRERKPTATAYQLGADGTPLWRVDVYLGDEPGFTDKEIAKLVENTTLSDPAKPIHDTQFIDDASPPIGAPIMTSVDPVNDLVLEYRRAVPNQAKGGTCYSSLVYYSKNNVKPGFSYFIYPAATDIVTAAVCSNRCRCTDPDLYLSVFSGFSWQFLQQGTYHNTLDTVGAVNAGCVAQDFEVEVFMALGGKHTLAITISGSV